MLAFSATISAAQQEQGIDVEQFKEAKFDQNGLNSLTLPILNQKERLGMNLFFDKRLSTPLGQACAACHGPLVGYTGPDSKINAHGAVYEGAVKGKFGNRKPPAAAYAGDSPLLHYDSSQGWIGGMFWDGRATGKGIYPNDPLAEQAMGPFKNPLEQNNADNKTVVDKVKTSTYKLLFYSVCGKGKSDDQYYACIAHSIAAFERSKVVNPFTSKYDLWLKGKVKLTVKEENGRLLFNGDKAKCSKCHVPPLFTDFTYDNLGVPKNPENPFYITNPGFIDLGLGDYLKSAGYGTEVYEKEEGKMKVPTLRNVDLKPYPGFIKAYSHNGYFKSLEEIVHFYNTRDVLGAGWNGVPWPTPEVSQNMNIADVGKLGLSPEEEAEIVAFMKTLSDWDCPICNN
jgi:cytochrome c peroxidase